jgi:hypothetical protein
MADAGVVLVAMPWEPLSLPSLPVGTLTAVLERAGLRVEARSLHLAFMEHCRSAAAPLALGDYHRIGRHHYDGWNAAFAVDFRSLRYRRGPDFLRISDRRPNLPARDYTLAEREG